MSKTLFIVRLVQLVCSAGFRLLFVKSTWTEQCHSKEIRSFLP